LPDRNSGGRVSPRRWTRYSPRDSPRILAVQRARRGAQGRL